jgi:hypothetical protein
MNSNTNIAMDTNKDIPLTPSIEPSPAQAPIPANDLTEIKNNLINSYKSSDDESSDDESFISSESSVSSVSSDEHKKKKKHKNKKDKHVSVYKVQVDKLEQRLHYMKLDLVNKDLDINVLKNKIILLEGNAKLHSNINFLFDRLDNAIKVLNEKLDSYQPTTDTIKDMVLLEQIDSMCVKAIEKYLTYLNTDVKPLFKDDMYLKQSTLLLYSEKDKTMNDISIKVKKHILDAKLKLNNKSSYLVWILFTIIIIMMGFSFFY